MLLLVVVGEVVLLAAAVGLAVLELEPHFLFLQDKHIQLQLEPEGLERHLEQTQTKEVLGQIQYLAALLQTVVAAGQRIKQITLVLAVLVVALVLRAQHLEMGIRQQHHHLKETMGVLQATMDFLPLVEEGRRLLEEIQVLEVHTFQEMVATVLRQQFQVHL